MENPIKRLFIKDSAKEPPASAGRNVIVDAIEGCIAMLLVDNRDDRGSLIELLTMRDGDQQPIVHVYQVFAAANSLRGWVYHERQTDRLAFTRGRFRIVLYDLRESSLTHGVFNEIIAGEDRKLLIRIPPMVAHAVQNLGDQEASFVNMPTRPYFHADPDKYRLPIEAGIIAFDFSR